MTEFTKDDSDHWQQYLHKTNYKILHAIKERIPKIAGKTLEEAALEGMARQAAENIVTILEEWSAIPRPPETKSPFVDTTKGMP